MKELPPVNFFAQLLAIIQDEELIRFRRRCEMRNMSVMVEVLTDEIEEREGIQKIKHGAIQQTQ